MVKSTSQPPDFSGRHVQRIHGGDTSPSQISSQRFQFFRPRNDPIGPLDDLKNPFASFEIGIPHEFLLDNGTDQPFVHATLHSLEDQGDRFRFEPHARLTLIVKTAV